MLEFPSTRRGEPLTISASSFVAYQQCPAMAAARFRGVYGPDSAAAFRGGLAHAVFARHLTQGPIADEAFDVTCKQLIGSSSLNHKVAALRLKPSQVTSAIEETQELYGRFKKLPETGFLGAEQLIEVTAPDDVRLVGRIDAIFGVDEDVRLIDWKTGNLGDPDAQLRFYSLLWVLDRQRLASSVEAYSVRTGETHQSVPTIDEVRSTLAEVVAMIEALRSGWESEMQFAVTAGPWCRYCPLLSTCDEGRAAVEIIDGNPNPLAVTKGH